MCEAAGLRVRVEVRSVNHRFAEFQIRMNREYLALEEVVRAVLAEGVARGHCDVFVQVDPVAPPQRTVRVDWRLLEQLVELQAEARRRGFDGARWLDQVDVVRVEAEEVDIAALADPVRSVAAEAVGQLRAMREREGARLAADLRARVSQLGEVVAGVAALAPAVHDQLLTRARQRVKELAAAVSEDRLLAEVALWSERTAVDEELVRLQSHIAEFDASLAAGSPIGRRLDFIAQEMLREVNTIGSKAGDVGIVKGVVEAKTVIEQLREQVQNIE